MKIIYIILTQSGTIFSKVLKFFTHDEYNHASICLSDDFETFYSFGRLKVNNAFRGGFVIENAFTNVFGKFKTVPCGIIRLEINDEQFETIQKIIEKFCEDRNKYKYDLINAILTGTKYSVHRENRFFCSEFVAYILNCANVTLPKEYIKMRPLDFCKIPNSSIIYNGELKKWCSIEHKKMEVG